MSLHAPCPHCGHVPAPNAPALDLDGRCMACGSIRTDPPPRPILAELADEEPAVRPIDLRRLRRRRTPERTPWAGWLAGGAAAAVFVAFCVIIVLLGIKGANAPPPFGAGPRDEDAARGEVREAFAAVEPAVQAAAAAELQPLFAELGAAFRAQDGHRLVAVMDVDRLFDACLAHGMIHQQYRWNRVGLVNGLRRGLSVAMPTFGQLMAWTSTQVRAVKRSPAGDELCVIARHRAANGANLRMRWWLVRRSGGWKVYDLEDLDVPNRISMQMALSLQQAPDEAWIARVKQTSAASQKIMQAFLALSNNDAKGAEAGLASLEGGPPLPPHVEALRHTAYASLRVHQERYQDALESIDRAARLQPDMPVLDMLRGAAYNGLGKGAEGLKHIDAYRALLGDDAHILKERGDSLRWLERFNEAAACYRQSLDEEPANAEAFAALVAVLGPADAHDDLPARFGKLPDARAAFVAVGEDNIPHKNHRNIELVAGLMRKVDPADAAISHYLALARAWQRRAAEAVPLFRQAQAAEKDAEWREAWRDQFLTAMAASDRPVLAYSAIADRRKAFRELAAALKTAYRNSELRELIAAHAKGHADDPALPLYRGEMLAQEGAYAAAEKAFADGAARPDAGPDLGAFRATRTTTRFHTAGPVDAYRAFGPSAETFKQLAELTLGQGTTEGLAALIAAHEKDEPTSPDLPWYRCRQAARQGRVGEAAALLAAVRARAKEGERDDRPLTFVRDARHAGKMVEAYRALPDAKQQFESLASDFLDGDVTDALRELVEAHRAAHPDDVAGAYYAGQVLAEDEEWDDAAEVLEKAWLRAEDAWKQRLRTSLVHTLYKSGRTAHAYATVGPRAETFTQLAGLLRMDRDGAGLQRLTDAERHRGGVGMALLLTEAHAVLLRGQADRAVALFARSRPGPADGNLVTALLGELTDAGRAADAYRLAADRGGAFATIARRLLAGKKTGPLMRLVEAHRAADPGDPAAHRIEAEVYLLRGDGARADQSLAVVLKGDANPNDWMTLQLLGRARVLRGRAVATYREQGGGPEAFHRLASVCLSEGRGDELAALVAARAADAPDDPALTGWRLEVRWLKGEYAALVRDLRAGREALSLLPTYRWILRDRLVRALIRLGRADQALQEASGATPDPILTALAHAARGDARNAAAALGGPGSRWNVPRAYADKDLGPLVRGAAMAAFRQRWPEPKVTSP